MLVLSRKRRERIIVGENAEIVVMVMDMNWHQVRLGIEAPHTIPVNREEIFKREFASTRSKAHSPRKPIVLTPAGFRESVR